MIESWPLSANYSSSCVEIRCLIFDLFGIMISFDEMSVYRRLAAHCDDSETALRAMQGLVSTPDLIAGRMTLAQLHQQLVTAHGLKLDFAKFQTNWLTPYTSAMPGTASLLEELSGTYRLILLSNVDRYYLEVVRKQHRELRHFAAQLVSCEMGIAEPNAMAFTLALRAAEAQPNECYFIDNKAENVDAARALGRRGHVFSNTQTLRNALVKDGIFPSV